MTSSAMTLDATTGPGSTPATALAGAPAAAVAGGRGTLDTPGRVSPPRLDAAGANGTARSAGTAFAGPRFGRPSASPMRSSAPAGPPVDALTTEPDDTPTTAPVDEQPPSPAPAARFWPRAEAPAAVELDGVVDEHPVPASPSVPSAAGAVEPDESGLALEPETEVHPPPGPLRPAVSRPALDTPIVVDLTDAGIEAASSADEPVERGAGTEALGTDTDTPDGGTGDDEPGGPSAGDHLVTASPMTVGEPVSRADVQRAASAMAPPPPPWWDVVATHPGTPSAIDPSASNPLAARGLDVGDATAEDTPAVAPALLPADRGQTMPSMLRLPTSAPSSLAPAGPELSSHRASEAEPIDLGELEAAPVGGHDSAVDEFDSEERSSDERELDDSGFDQGDVDEAADEEPVDGRRDLEGPGAEEQGPADAAMGPTSGPDDADADAVADADAEPPAWSGTTIVGPDPGAPTSPLPSRPSSDWRSAGRAASLGHHSVPGRATDRRGPAPLATPAAASWREAPMPPDETAGEWSPPAGAGLASGAMLDTAPGGGATFATPRSGAEVAGADVAGAGPPRRPSEEWPRVGAAGPPTDAQPSSQAPPVAASPGAWWPDPGAAPTRRRRSLLARLRFRAPAVAEDHGDEPGEPTTNQAEP